MADEENESSEEKPEEEGGQETGGSEDGQVGDTMSSKDIESIMDAINIEGQGAPQEILFGEADEPAEGAPVNLDILMDVDLDVKIELGRTRMYVEDIIRLQQGSVVELDKLAGEPVDVRINERLVARGEILVLNDNFCVRITEILDPQDREN